MSEKQLERILTLNCTKVLKEFRKFQGICEKIKKKKKSIKSKCKFIKIKRHCIASSPEQRQKSHPSSYQQQVQKPGPVQK